MEKTTNCKHIWSKCDMYFFLFERLSKCLLPKAISIMLVSLSYACSCIKALKLHGIFLLYVGALTKGVGDNLCPQASKEVHHFVTYSHVK